MKTILVTGGAGFVGSHACKALSRAGYLPVTFDNLERGYERAVKWGPLEQGDLRNERDLQRAFKAHRPWAVMHFAAYAYVGESTDEPAKYYDNNIGGTAKLIQACATFECKNVVFSSSCATYGVPERLPLKEDAAQNPVNPYGYTKLVVERMLKDAEAAHGIRHVALRYSNAAGADPDCIGPKPISFHSFCSLRWGASRRSRYSDMTIRRPTAPVSGITCTSAIWPTRTSRPSTGSGRSSRAMRSIWAMAAGSRSPRS
jgi:UDP-glucose 4-epimerase